MNYQTIEKNITQINAQLVRAEADLKKLAEVHEAVSKQLEAKRASIQALRNLKAEFGDLRRNEPQWGDDD